MIPKEHLISSRRGAVPNYRCYDFSYFLHQNFAGGMEYFLEPTPSHYLVLPVADRIYDT